MKLSIFKIAFITTVLAASSMVHAQSTHDETIYVSNTDIYNIDLDQKSISVGVSYPGPTISGVCGIEIRADSYGRHKPIQDLLAAVNIKHSNGENIVVQVINRSTILLNLATMNGSYGFWLSIETKDKSTLKQTIKNTLGDSRTIILLGSTCL